MSELYKKITAMCSYIIQIIIYNYIKNLYTCKQISHALHKGNLLTRRFKMKAISYDRYYDKVRGGWIGKCLGGTIGCFEGTKQITGLNIYDLLPEKMVANDDLDIQLVWMDVLLDKGIYFTSEHLMQAWIAQYDYNFGEYATGRRNYRRGLKPPVCGRYANDFYITGMGCPIRSEIWGMIAPGSSNLAAGYAYKDGILDHDGESVWAEQFLSAMEARAFFEDDLQALIDEGLKYVPVDSTLWKCIEEARQSHAEGILWQETWKRLRDGYGHPDCTYAPQNLGIIVMALLYGEKDFDRTLTIAVNSAWDVDCTCSTTAALLGIITGYEAFDRKWLNYIGDDIVTLARPVNPMHSIKLLTEYTCRAGVTIMKEGLTEVRITGVPEDLPLLKAEKYTGRVSIDADYCGDPVITAGCPKRIKLIVENNTAEGISGTLNPVEVPEAFEIEAASGKMTLEPGERRIMDVCVNIRKDAGIIRDANIIKYEFKEDGRPGIKYEFGLCGAPAALVAGPFYDTYMEWLRKEDMPKSRLLRSGDEVVIIPEASEEWGNHRVDIDKAYMAEDFGTLDRARAAFAGSRRCSIKADRYVLKDAFGFQGSACAYFFHEIICPEDREGVAFIGSSDPYKVWLNGELISEQKDNRFWFPNQDVPKVKLKEGVNYVVVKIARKGADNTFTMAFRHKQELWGYDSNPYMTDLAFVLPEGR